MHWLLWAPPPPKKKSRRSRGIIDHGQWAPPDDVILLAARSVSRPSGFRSSETSPSPPPRNGKGGWGLICIHRPTCAYIEVVRMTDCDDEHSLMSTLLPFKRMTKLPCRLAI